MRRARDARNYTILAPSGAADTLGVRGTEFIIEVGENGESAR